MSYFEALEDGIRQETHSDGCNWYFPLCAKCGNEVPNWNYKRDVEYVCKKCKLEKAISDKRVKAELNSEAKERKFKGAVARILEEINPKDEDAYVVAAEKVKNKLHRPGWFDSTEEIMVAIELLKNGIKTRHQVKFGTRYRADFVLPDLKMVLEVDGVCFHNEFSRQREDLRDSCIVASLGPEWEVIRITDQMINQNITKLVPAIKQIKEKRAKVRAKNEGRLPEWYTDRKMT